MEGRRGLKGDVRATDGTVVTAIRFDDFAIVAVANGAVATGSLYREVGCHLPQ